MLKQFSVLVSLIIFVSYTAVSQGLIQAGPMLGYTELRTTKIWISVTPEVSEVSIVYHPANQDGNSKRLRYEGVLNKAFNPITFDLYGLTPATRYKYSVIAADGSKKQIKQGEFTTQVQWRYDSPAPDFSFLMGSCSYFNDEYDTGKPYGGDSSIYITMFQQEADFMLWLGDNWYTREVDYQSKWGLWYRANYVRSQPVLQNFLSAMPHYAIWDDHDFGPNNFGSNYIYKDESRNVFKNYWANPSYGIGGKGIYTSFNYSDVSFFLLDDRTWRSSDNMKDSTNGQANPEKKMLGKEQMQWLKNALLESNANFKIIANGSQMLNKYTRYDCFYHFPIEFIELIGFIAYNKIEGVVFVTGDRHHSEILKMERAGHYNLYEITTSPLSARLYNASGKEKDMPILVRRVEDKHNFSKVSITGGKANRMLTVEYYDNKGNKLTDWSITADQLKYH